MFIGIQSSVWNIIGRAKYQFLDRNYIQTIRFVLITTCLLLSVLISILMTNRIQWGLILLAGVVGACSLIFVYRHLEITCVSIIVVSTALNFGVGSGTGTPIMLSLVILLVCIFIWLVKLFIAERSFQSVRKVAPNWPIMLFILVVPISFVWSTIYVEGPVRLLFESKLNPRLMTGLVMMISPAAILLFGNHVRSVRSFKFIVFWFIAMGLIVGAMRFVNMPIPIFINAKGQFGPFVVALALGQLLFNRDLPWPWLLRPILLLASAIWVYVAIALGISWLSGWLPIVLGIGVLAFFKSRKLFVLVVLVSAVFVLANTSYLDQVFEAENHESGETRTEAAGGTLRYFYTHYLFGTGPAGYHYYMEVLVSTQRSHNNYIDILAQTGIVGFSIWIWMWLAVGWMVWKTFRTVPQGGFRHALAASLLAAYFITLMSMMLGDWITPFPYTQTLAGVSYTFWHWIMAGLAMALYFESRTAYPEPRLADTASV